jgi:hypothetical protein
MATLQKNIAVLSNRPNTFSNSVQSRNTSNVTVADMMDAAPISGVGSISTIPGGIILPDMFTSSVSFTHRNLTPDPQNVLFIDPIGLVSQKAKLTGAIPPTSCSFGSAATFNAWLASTKVTFKGINYKVSQLAQQSELFNFYKAWGKGVIMQEEDPLDYERNTPNNPNIMTFACDIAITKTSGFSMIVQGNTTINLTFYMKEEMSQLVIAR